MSHDSPYHTGQLRFVWPRTRMQNLPRNRPLRSLSRLSRAILFPALIAALIPALSGCGGGKSAGDRGDSGAAETGKLQRYELSALPVGDYLPPLEEGRIELADPKGWRRHSKSSSYLASFYHEKRELLPKIVVTSDANPYASIDNATEENLPELLELVAQEVKDRKELLEAPEPMVLGGRPFVRYVTNATHKNKGAERQILVTVISGRRYTIDLQIYKRTIKQFQDAAYAVAASLKPGAGAGATIPPPVDPADNSTDNPADNPASGQDDIPPLSAPSQ